MRTIRFLAFLLLLALTLLSCDHPRGDMTEHKRYYVITYDGCEYVRTGEGVYDNAATMAHKGNCNNPIHSCSGRMDGDALDGDEQRRTERQLLLQR